VDDHSINNPPLESELPNFLQWFYLFWVNRRVFFVFAFFAGILSILISLMIPNNYAARAYVLPPQPSGSGLSGLVAELSQFSGGIQTNEFSVALYAPIASSATILKAALKADYQNSSFEKAFLPEELRDRELTPEEYDELINDIKKSLAVSLEIRNGLVTLTFIHRNAELSAAFLNQILVEMDKFFEVSLKSKATNRRNMIEERIAQVTDSLKNVEEEYVSFRESNNQIQFSPKLMQIDVSMQRKILALGTVYSELFKQLEIAKIEEIDNRNVLNILDWAEVPKKKFSPHRSVYVFGFVLTTIFLLVVWFKLREAEWIRSLDTYSKFWYKIYHSKPGKWLRNAR